MMAIRAGLKEVDTLKSGCRSNMSLLLMNTSIDLIDNCIDKGRHISLSLIAGSKTKAVVKTFKNVSIVKGYQFEYELGKPCTAVEFIGDVGA